MIKQRGVITDKQSGDESVVDEQASADTVEGHLAPKEVSVLLQRPITKDRQGLHEVRGVGNSLEEVTCEVGRRCIEQGEGRGCRGMRTVEALPRYGFS